MNINATLIGQSVIFILFVLFCMKYVWPALLGVMVAREKRIEDGLNAADRADKDLELAQQKAVTYLKDAKEKASSIIEQANKRATQIVDEAAHLATDEADRIKAQATVEVSREVAQAREKLRGEVAVLAIAGAEKVLGSSIDASSHTAMLEKLAAQL